MLSGRLAWTSSRRKPDWFPEPVIADLLPNEKLQIDTVAEKVQEKEYRLDKSHLLTAVEGGQKFDHLAEFLAANHQGELPPVMVDWLAHLKRNIRAFKEGETAVIIKIAQQDGRHVLKQDHILSELCQPVNESAVIVMTKHLLRFRNRLKELGYLLHTG